MKGRPQQETRSEVIQRHTTRMFHETRCSREAFGQTVVENYHRLVPAEARDIQFKTEGDFFHCAKINAQKLMRYVDDRVNARMPVDLEEAWVLALSEPYRADCLHDLARRYGLLAVPVPTDGATALQSMSSVTREFGQACEAIAPIIANGSFGPEDVEFAEKAERELEDLITSATGMLHQVRRLRGTA